MEDDTTPYCYVQIPNEFESTPEPYGSEFSGINTSTATYQIVVVDSQKDTATAQARVLELIEKVRVILVANPTVSGKITRMNVSKASRKSSQPGSEKVAMFFTVGIVIGAEFSIEFPSPIGTVNMLSWPLDTTELITDDDILDDGSRVVSPKNDKDRIDVEIETNFTRSALFKTMLQAKDEISVTLNNGSDTLVLTVLMVSFLKPVPFDQYQRAVVGLEVINT